MRSVIQRELRKWLEFGYAVKRYMQKTESVLENKTHKKILSNFQIKRNTVSPSEEQLVDCAVSLDHRVKM